MLGLQDPASAAAAIAGTRSCLLGGAARVAGVPGASLLPLTRGAARGNLPPSSPGAPPRVSVPWIDLPPLPPHHHLDWTALPSILLPAVVSQISSRMPAHSHTLFLTPALNRRLPLALEALLCQPRQLPLLAASWPGKGLGERPQDLLSPSSPSRSSHATHSGARTCHGL